MEESENGSSGGNDEGMRTHPKTKNKFKKGAMGELGHAVKHPTQNHFAKSWATTPWRRGWIKHTTGLFFLFFSFFFGQHMTRRRVWDECGVPSRSAKKNPIDKQQTRKTNLAHSSLFLYGLEEERRLIHEITALRPRTQPRPPLSIYGLEERHLTYEITANQKPSRKRSTPSQSSSFIYGLEERHLIYEITVHRKPSRGSIPKHTPCTKT
jgi:hypothetical protein